MVPSKPGPVLGACARWLPRLVFGLVLAAVPGRALLHARDAVEVCVLSPVCWSCVGGAFGRVITQTHKNLCVGPGPSLCL